MDPTSMAGIFERAMPQAMMSPSVAHEVLKIRLPEADLARMSELCERGNAGTLRPDELPLLENYRRTSSLISILHIRALGALRNAGEPLPAGVAGVAHMPPQGVP